MNFSFYARLAKTQPDLVSFSPYPKWILKTFFSQMDTNYVISSVVTDI